MRVTTSLLPLLFCSLTVATFFGAQKVLHDSDLSVPGENPLQYCRATDDNIFVIDYVDLDPNPPQGNTNLTIEASGNFTQKVEDGAYVQLTVKYNKYITLINTREDLCEQLKSLDKECPIEKGNVNVTLVVKLPVVPYGSYSVFADAYTKDDEKLTCLTADVAFKRG
ncbi:Phosphatidylglycerol/phosphatidylinositol transfer protein [Lambiella insularis]|nr:Phosphatidylglycerol/phosphatidylinositol transfer protein [Lambiella insularis]